LKAILSVRVGNYVLPIYYEVLYGCARLYVQVTGHFFGNMLNGQSAYVREIMQTSILNYLAFVSEAPIIIFKNRGFFAILQG